MNEWDLFSASTSLTLPPGGSGGILCVSINYNYLLCPPATYYPRVSNKFQKLTLSSYHPLTLLSELPTVLPYSVEYHSIVNIWGICTPAL
jgi:hypothetical protein